MYVDAKSKILIISFVYSWMVGFPKFGHMLFNLIYAVINMIIWNAGPS